MKELQCIIHPVCAQYYLQHTILYISTYHIYVHSDIRIVQTVCSTNGLSIDCVHT